MTHHKQITKSGAKLNNGRKQKMKNLTIEQLAEKLGGKLWTKGDLKRIYLDRGYNTKKMSTKTYVYQREDGTFGVSCFIDCPSQDFNWIKSQQNEVIGNVMSDIEDALATTYYVVVDANGAYLNDNQKPVTLNNLSRCDYFLTETGANNWMKAEYLENCTIKAFDRTEFENEVERLDEIERVERAEKAAIVAANKPAEVS